MADRVMVLCDVCNAPLFECECDVMSLTFGTGSV